MSTIKDIPQFLWLKHYIMDKGYNVGHPLFSLGHIIWLAIIILICILVAKRYSKTTKNKQDLYRKICAITIFALEYVKIVLISFLFPHYIDSYVPLHLCTFSGIFIIVDALWPNNKIVNMLWLYVFLPGGVLGIVSPSTTYPWLNFFSIHEFLFHGLIVVYGVFKIAIGESKATYKGVWVSTLFILLLIIPIYYIDITFDKGYMLLTTPSDFPLTKLLWNISTPIFGNKGYIALLLCLELILFHIIYFVGKVFQRKNKEA
ncbi:MAG: YwaF family protein [Clostridia bacterium]|nr:YwaF family protein [Clostridia bacterium]